MELAAEMAVLPSRLTRVEFRRAEQRRSNIRITDDRPGCKTHATFGSQPEFYFETPIVLDNTTKQVVDDAALSFQVFVVGQRAGRCRSDPDISFATLNRIDDYSRNQGKWHSSAEVGFSGSNRRASYRSSTKSPSGSTIPRTKLSGSPK